MSGAAGDVLGDVDHAAVRDPGMLAALMGSLGLDIVRIQSDQRDRSPVIASDASEVHGVRGLEPAWVGIKDPTW